jgi:hypothetical protein
LFRAGRAMLNFYLLPSSSVILFGFGSGAGH